MSMKHNIIRLMTMAVFSAIFIGCAVDETGIEGSFPYLEIDYNTKQLSKVTQPEVIEVRTNRAITVNFNPSVSWINAEVVGNQISLIYEDNTFEEERTVTLVITTVNSTVSKNIIITQDASGELTYKGGDLILRTREEIANNTYTKTVGNLVIGNVTVPTKSVSNSVQVKLGDSTYTVAESDITDEDLAPLYEMIHEVQGKGLVIANTKVATIPQDLITSNDIERLCFDYNNLKNLPPTENLNEMSLVELSVKGNDLTDIASLAGCTTIETLDISENEVSNIEPLKNMPALQEVAINNLPVTEEQVEVFKETTDFNVEAEELRPDESQLPLFGEFDIKEISDNHVEIKIPVIKNADNIINYGFFIGNTRSIEEMTFNKATNSNGTLTLSYHPETILGKIFYVRAYAENGSGGNYSETAYFGNVISEEDMYIKSDSDFAAFSEYPYSHINGSLFVGKTSKSGSGVLLDNGAYRLYFAPATFSDLSPLRQLVFIRDGLYMGNIGLTNLDEVAHITGIQTLWLKANKLSHIPTLKSAETITDLDVSMNNLEDFKFLDKLPALERVTLGSSKTVNDETNDIGVLTGMEKYTNLKYIDLSGLPLHDWQVEDLKAMMPETEITFVSSGRTPHIPAVKIGRMNRTETSVTLVAQITSKGKSDILEYGFYYGKDLNNLQKVMVGTSISEGSTFNLTIDLPDMDMYYFYPYAINSQGESRCDYEEFSLSYMNLSTGETANCYHIALPGRYKFDARVRGNSYESVGNAVSAEVLWQFTDPYNSAEVITNLELVDGFVKFEIPEEITYGNALIAVKNASGKVLWSWHIWISDFEIDATSYRTNSGTIVMERNLGATIKSPNSYDEKLRASGTMYQWGRKDPMTNWTITGNRGAFYSLQESYANPTEFAASSEWGAPWIERLESLRGLWLPAEKTMHDPCPAGWQVADRTMFVGGYSSFYNEYYIEYTYDSGYKASCPFSPWFDSGYNFNDPTSEARIWLSDDDLYSGWYLFYYSGVTVGTTGGVSSLEKSYAMSVRCMKDLGVKFIDMNVKPRPSSVVITADIESKYGYRVEDKGVVWCYDYRGTPTIGNNEVYQESLGSGVGSFSVTIDDLASDTSYNVRAYVTIDGMTKYSEVHTFKTGKAGTGDDFTEDDYVWE